MEEFRMTFPASQRVRRRAHVGVVSSGDLELLLEPGNADEAIVVVQTKVSGYRKIWETLLKRFFERHAFIVSVEIRDGGATPGTVWLRLEQGMELAVEDRADE